MFEKIKNCMRKFYCPHVECSSCKLLIKKIQSIHPRIEKLIDDESGGCDLGGKDWPEDFEETYQPGGFTALPLLGCTVHGGWSGGDQLQKIQKAHELGCNVVRVDCIAEAYNHGMRQGLLEYVQKAKSYGMRTMFVLGMGSNNTDPSWDVKPKPMDANYITEYLQFIDTVSSDFSSHRGSIILQILNEYNETDMFYTVTLDRYMEILQAAYPKGKANGFSEVVMGGLIGHHKDNGTQAEYIGRMCDKGLNSCSDALCFHWYYGTTMDLSWCFVENISSARSKGFNKFVYITEFGINGEETGDAKKIQVFDNMYRKAFREHGVNLACWYVMKANTRWDILDAGYNPNAAYNHIKNNKNNPL